MSEQSLTTVAILLLGGVLGVLVAMAVAPLVVDLLAQLPYPLDGGG